MACGVTTIAYRFWRDAWFDYDGLLDWLCGQPRLRSVCEVGAGANPVLSAGRIAAAGLRHAILDVSQEELDKAPAGYRKIKADITTPGFALDEPVDIVASSFVAEHLPSPETFHLNVLNMLRPGGVALHLFPTLYALPFVLNRTLPESTTDRVLARFQRFREREGNEGKFTAYYRWCRGPTERQLHRVRDIGYEIVAYRGYFGHGYYLHLGLLNRLETLKTGLLLKHPQPGMASYAVVVLRRPGPGADPLPPVPAHPRSREIVSTGTKRQLEAGWT